jgi:hypothetical protein
VTPGAEVSPGAAGAAPDDVLDAGRRVDDLDRGHAGELGNVGGGEHRDTETLLDEPGGEVGGGHLEGDVSTS